MYTRSTISMEEYGWPAGYADYRQDRLTARTRRRQAAVKAERRKELRKRKRRQARRSSRVAGIVLLLLAVSAVFAFATWQGHTPASSIALRNSGCPKELIKLAERQPEAYAFARDYADHANETFDPDTIDITEDIMAGGIPHFLQWDERWGYAGYGDSYLAVTGCGPTCLSMVYCGTRGDIEWNPLKMARFAEENGYYVNGVGTAWSLMEEGASKLGLSVYAEYPSAETITAELQDGKTIICSVFDGDFTSNGHFIVLAGIADDGKVIVRDPNSIARTSQTWDAQRIADQTAEMWVYE